MTRRTLLASLAAPRKPNVLFISVDDMNDWVGCLGGYPGVKTPNIDALARRGALFADTHCAAPLCNPSRTALLSGKRPSTTGIYGNEQWWRPVHPDLVTLPMYFRQNGYLAAGAGKVFHHTAGFNPPDQWDEFQLQVFDDPWYRRPEWYPWNKKEPNPKDHPFNGLDNFQGEFDWGVLPGRPENEYGDMRAIEFGEKWLGRKHDKPFFLSIGLWHPHIPMFAPQNYFDLYPDPRIPEVPETDLDDVPKAGQQLAAFRRSEHERIVKEGKWRDAVRAYLAAISFADAMIGRLIKALDASTHAQDTIVVFWSDNGWHLGEKRHWHKSTLWQRSTHVPMIWAGPGVKQTGQSRTQPVSLLDIYPTLVDLCGLPKRNDLDGLSLAPQLRDAKTKRAPAVSTFLPGNHAVITEHWRYIRYKDGGEELYDRKADKNEYRNLASDASKRSLMSDLAKFIPKAEAPEAPEREAYDFDFAKHTWRRK